MEYQLSDVVLWSFTHPDIKAAYGNFLYVCWNKIGDPMQTPETNFIHAFETLNQIVEIGNPSMCGSMFEKALKSFAKSRKQLRDEHLLVAYMGEMFCNSRMQRNHLNRGLQQEISTIEYKGSFWDRYGEAVIDLGHVAIAGAMMLAGCPTNAAAGGAVKSAQGLNDSHRSEVRANRNTFEQFRNILLSLHF